MKTYLALGDSYTIGEQVPFAENFPNQTVQLLRKMGFSFYAAEIIAQTGWTTDELDHAIENTITPETYDVVSLLVGVNNQYRGRTVVEFKIEFEQLLQRAIQFAGNKPYRVFVLSIPDWGVTPFAESKDRKQVADEIDAYNYICETSAKQFLANYINITGSQRKDGNNIEFLAADQLHPSGKEYQKWAVKLADAILKRTLMMKPIEFKEVQRFRIRWAWLAVAALNLLFIYAIIQQLILGKPFGSKPAPGSVLIIVELVFLALLMFLISIKLKTRITDTGIYYRFYPFQFKETFIEWPELKDAYIREYHSFYEYGGWGIRTGTEKTGKAINTSESSNKGLQLEFNDHRLLLIGTKRPEEIQTIVDQLIATGKVNRRI